MAQQESLSEEDISPQPGTSKSQEAISPAIRQQRNQAEKQRRDRLNGYIAQLATLVPMVRNSTKPLDKVSVLRLAAAHMRLNYSCLNQKNFASERPSLPPNIASSLELVEKNLGGFIVVTTFSGVVLFCSKGVEDVVGYQNIDLMGQSIYNYVHDEETLFFERKIKSMVFQYKRGKMKRSTKVIKLHLQLRPLPRTNDVRYQKVMAKLSIHANGLDQDENKTRKILEKDKKKTKQKDFGSSAIVLMYIEPAKPEPSLTASYLLQHQDIYFTIHGVKGEILYSDHRIATVTGFMPKDVLGTSAYGYIFPSDVPIALFAQNAMFSSNDGTGLIVYRLQIFDSSYIYLQSQGKVIYKDSSTDISHFVCYNRWLSEKEGSKVLKRFHERYAPQIATNPAEEGSSADTEIMEVPAEYVNNNISSPALLDQIQPSSVSSRESPSSIQNNDIDMLSLSLTEVNSVLCSNSLVRQKVEEQGLPSQSPVENSGSRAAAVFSPEANVFRNLYDLPEESGNQYAEHSNGNQYGTETNMLNSTETNMLNPKESRNPYTDDMTGVSVDFPTSKLPNECNGQMDNFLGKLVEENSEADTAIDKPLVGDAEYFYMNQEFDPVSSHFCQTIQEAFQSQSDSIESPELAPAQSQQFSVWPTNIDNVQTPSLAQLMASPVFAGSSDQVEALNGNELDFFRDYRESNFSTVGSSKMFDSYTMEEDKNSNIVRFKQKEVATSQTLFKSGVFIDRPNSNLHSNGNSLTHYTENGYFPDIPSDIFKNDSTTVQNATGTKYQTRKYYTNGVPVIQDNYTNNPVTMLSGTYTSRKTCTSGTNMSNQEVYTSRKTCTSGTNMSNQDVYTSNRNYSGMNGTDHSLPDLDDVFAPETYPYPSKRKKTELATKLQHKKTELATKLLNIQNKIDSISSFNAPQRVCGKNNSNMSSNHRDGFQNCISPSSQINTLEKRRDVFDGNMSQEVFNELDVFFHDFPQSNCVPNGSPSFQPTQFAGSSVPGVSQPKVMSSIPVKNVSSSDYSNDFLLGKGW